MPDTATSNLPAAGALAGTEPVPVVQGGLLKRTTAAAIAGLAALKTVAGRVGDVVLTVADVSGAAPLASPAITGSLTINGLAVAGGGSGATDPTVNTDSTLGYAVNGRYLNTATGEVFVCYSNAAGAAVWLPMDVSDHPGYIAGLMYALSQASPTAGSAVLAVDTLYLFPFTLKSRVAISALFGRCTTAGAGSSAKFAIWGNKAGRPTGVPVLAANAGIATTAIGMVSLAAAGTLNPARYWAGSKFTGTLPSMAAIPVNVGSSWAVGAVSQGNALSGGSGVAGVSAPDAYANNIAATDLTAASFTTITTPSIPALGMNL